jgi:hypothetical protein
MTIKPVLVPDHDAASLRKLMDHFATASTGPTKKQLNESRAAVAAAQGVTESSDDSGAYDKWDPKHPDFVKNYKKFQAKNPGATLKDYIADLKKGVTEGQGMSRAAKGYEKYGREGMQALAKAGREGRALDPVRDRYDRYDEAVAEGLAGEELKAIDGDYYEDSTDFFSMFEQDHFDREEESEDGMEIRGYIDDHCVMVFKYSTPDMMGGWGNYDDSALIAESGVEDDDEGDVCPECDGAGCPECYGEEDRDRAHDHAQGTQRESTDMAEAPRDREDDERHDLDPSDWYIVKDGKLLKASIYPNQHDQARAEGFSPTREQARAQAANKGITEGNNYDQNITVYGNKQGYFAWDKSSPVVRTPLNDEYEITMTSINPHKTGFVDKLKTNMKMTQFKLSQLPPNLQDEIVRILRDYHTAGFQGGLRQYHKNRQDNDLDETADGVKYGVFAKGGSVGSQRFRDDPLKTFDTREEAVADARRRRSGLSKGERGYYRMGYVVKPIKGEVDEGMIDSIKNTVRAANYDRLARRSNSQAVAGGGFAPPAQFKSLSAKGDQRAQKAQDIRKGSAEQVDEIDMGLVGDAVAGAAMGLGSVGLGSYIGHKIGNKIGQKFIDRSNRKKAEAGRKPAEAGSEKMQAIEKARAARIAANKAYRDHENLHGYELAQDHPEYQNRVNLGNKKFRNMDVPSAFDEEQQVDEKSEAIRHGNNSRSIYHVDEGIDPIEQLRADIRRFAQ